jgi:hypothetical protein
MTRSEQKPCERLRPFFDGELEPEAAGSFRRHLEACETCRTSLKALEDLREGLLASQNRALSEEAELRMRAFLHREIQLGKAFGEILDMEDVSRLLNIPVSEVAALLDQLPHFEIAGRLRFRKEAIMKWIDEREEPSAHGGLEPSRTFKKKIILFPRGAS